MPFKQMENITQFQQVAREWGVPESSLFGTPDLYEGKNMGSVIKCIYAFGGAVKQSRPQYTGPAIGIVAVESHDVKRDLGMCTDTTEGMHRAMEVERPKYVMN